MDRARGNEALDSCLCSQGTAYACPPAWSMAPPGVTQCYRRKVPWPLVNLFCAVHYYQHCCALIRGYDARCSDQMQKPAPHDDTTTTHQCASFFFVFVLEWGEERSCAGPCLPPDTPIISTAVAFTSHHQSSHSHDSFLQTLPERQGRHVPDSYPDTQG